MKNVLIKTEEFTDENGNKMIREYYGKNKDNISATVEKPVQTDQQIEQPIEESISQDEVIAEMLLNQSAIIAKQEEQYEVLAEILLNQMGGE